MKILVISLSGIGDSLIAAPLLEELRENFPDAEIDIFVLWEQAKKLLENNPYTSRTYQFNMFKEGYLKSLLYCLKLRGKKYDVSINVHPQSKIQYMIIAKIINAKKRLSHLYDNKSFLDKFLINRSLEQDYSVSSIDNNLNLLKLINAEPKLEKHNYKIFLSKEDNRKAEEFFKKNKLKGKIIGIHAGSGTTKNMALKRWALSNYIELTKKLLQDKKIRILLFGGPDEKEENKKLIDEVDNKRVILVETESIRESAAIIKKCHLFLSVDNLLMHVASAMNVKQIVIAGPTYDKAVEPKTKPIVIKAELECRPCYRYNGEGIKCKIEEKMRCLKEISAERVYNKISEVLIDKK